MKLIFLVIDGMGDRPVGELEGKTPLEAADTPNLDRLVSDGKTGLMYPVRKGVAPESDSAVISILGYDPFKYYTGRGPLEACGAGLKIEDGDLALRCNFATLSEGGAIVDRRVGRDLTTREAVELSEAINAEVQLESHPAEFEFKGTIGHRGVLVIRHKERRLSGEINNTDPAYSRMGDISIARPEAEMKLQKCEALNGGEAAKISADLVNEFTEKTRLMLDRHPLNLKRASEGKLKANGILMRDAGASLPKFFDLGKKYGVRFVCFADMPVEIGIAKLAGMDVVRLTPLKGNLQDYGRTRARKLRELFPSYDCFYIHVKGPDEPSHDGNFRLKTQMIGDIDRYFIEEALSNIDLNDCIICVTADHSTPCELKSHSDDPVPVLIAGDGVEADGGVHFSERECKAGSLGTLQKGTELMPLLMKLLREADK